MTRSVWITALVCAWAAPVSGGGAPDWERLQIEGLFSLRVPPSGTYRPAQGMDSRVGTISVPGMSFQFDYGRYSDSLARAPSDQDYVVRDVIVDGRPAKLVTAQSPGRAPGQPYLIGLHVPDVRMSPPRTLRLTISSFSKDPPDYPTAERMLMSVRFPAAGN